ncbi:MAG: hypothetical protein M1817_006436 [Caeruleum heppii]|nr:MAG: hypothetical protein M1817_006436 [Caeruleum heppii]
MTTSTTHKNMPIQASLSLTDNPTPGEGHGTSKSEKHCGDEDHDGEESDKEDKGDKRDGEVEGLTEEIRMMERVLEQKKERLRGLRREKKIEEGEETRRDELDDLDDLDDSRSLPSHALLLLADTALPLGSFAYSVGLESYLAHRRLSPSPSNTLPTTTTPQPTLTSPLTNLESFLPLSLTSLSSTTLPLLIAAYRSPARYHSINEHYDATLICTVQRRASLAQGRAVVGVWSKIFSPHFSQISDPPSKKRKKAAEMLSSLQHSSKEQSISPPHYPTTFPLLFLTQSIPLQSTVYVYLLSHLKTILSAAVRAGVLGPYQAQGILASRDIEGLVRGEMRRWEKAMGLGGGEEDGKNGEMSGEGCGEEGEEEADEDSTIVRMAGQTIPILDLWSGRHEMLYSRIFNS